MIKICKPYIVPQGDSFSRLVSDIYVDGEKRTVWAEVENKYRDYLCDERSDAFVLGLLHYAMTYNHDIVCEAPMGEDLYYQLTTYVIDAISKGSHFHMHPIHLTADVDRNELPCAGKVGTGISCGVDSLHVLAHLDNEKLPAHRLTHLAFNNVGSNGEGERAQSLFAQRKKQAEAFCKEYGYELTAVNSNIMDQFEQSHLMTCIFTCMFSIFVIQKLYSVYYIASSTPIYLFSLDDNHLKDASFYEFLMTTMCSTEKMKIYCQGNTLNRLEKVSDLAKYEPSYKYLNVCIRTADNCSKCEKCSRTLLALDALGVLEKYRAVFDIDYYKSHRQWYLSKMFIQYVVFHNEEYDELYPILKKDIKFTTYFKLIPKTIFTYVYSKNRERPMVKKAVRIYKSMRKKGQQEG